MANRPYAPPAEAAAALGLTRRQVEEVTGDEAEESYIIGVRVEGEQLPA